MQKLIDEKEKEGTEIRDKIAILETEIIKTEEQKEKAMENTDIKLYESKTKEIEHLQMELEMFKSRYLMLSENRKITETESDSVIDSIIAYEQEKEIKYYEDIMQALETVKSIHEEYTKEVKEAEDTIRDWTMYVHPNYRSFNRTLYRNGTHRSDTPIPVRSIPYTGSKLCHIVDVFLRDEKSYHRTREFENVY